MNRPFLGSTALETGLLTRRELRAGYRAVYRGVYLANEVALTARLRAEAAWLFAGPDAVLCGLSAAAVHGTEWLDADAPAEVVRSNRHSPTGLTVHSYALAPDDVCMAGGMRATSAARTAFDLGRLLPEDQAVPTLDALLNATGLDPARVWALAEANRGIRGVDRLRIALGLADGGSESPLQTQTRLLLRRTGIPGLRTQIPFYDEWGLVCTRAALGWPRWQVAVECDEDADTPGYREWVHSHTAELESRGWSVIWVTKSTAEGRGSPGPVVLRAQEKLWAAQRRRASRAACVPQSGDADFVRSRARSAD
ncbi:hypothetical protein [Mycolicibacterium mucogenicum]|uniref:Cullin, a subunit of E3 ubiquitin ligase n=1 Tax=Mycolicibacterium mucogenicum DSM 44124 TaxID=1226753 RepID=A0A8E4R8B1_MYCMU|nr:hypothetical protein [Mycolicibacterium mucogenicum]KAB7751651.1 hypothetical protein MMUC44124_29295 [Mycolicibacterium mucogenicum DSM 44124]QPG69715.1 hypothetical protein C1S78_001350 [Mycolicibacterium mucogenicum DSM 44124]